MKVKMAINLGGTAVNKARLRRKRSATIRRLRREENTCFFSGFYPGSHEFTEEGFQAAQANEREKTQLRSRLQKLNEQLGLQPDSRHSP